MPTYASDAILAVQPYDNRLDDDLLSDEKKDMTKEEVVRVVSQTSDTRSRIPG